MAQELNLSTVFGEIAKTLSANQQQLNDADDYNHNHGTNMVETFQQIQKAVSQKEGEPVSDQLAYASKVLEEKTSGSTAKIYAEGLANASKQFVGKDFNAETAGTLINSMMGMSDTQKGGGDLLSTLLGSLGGNAQAAQESPAPSTPSDASNLLGSLLGGLTGNSEPKQEAAQSSGGGIADLLGGLMGNQSNSQQSSGGLGELIGGMLDGGSATQSQNGGVDASTLLSAGLAYFAAKQSGKNNLEAITQALSSSSPLSEREDQQQSGALVINTILGLLSK